MILETALGGVFGGVLRFAPEVLKFMDRKGDRTHELKMFGLQLEADKLKGDQALSLARTQAEASADQGEISLLLSAIQAQAKPSGVPWVDALSVSVRPILTYWWCVGLYSAALICQYLEARHAGAGNIQAVLGVWGGDEKAIVASMLAFWFADRTLRKRGIGK
jgi:hypothetical protein